MTEVEKRRIKLLRETRKTYSEKGSPPAVHPRYQSAYKSLYGNEEEEEIRGRSTFFVRVVISILLLVLFYVMDDRKEEFGTVDSQFIVQEVQRDLLGQ